MKQIFWPFDVFQVASPLFLLDRYVSVFSHFDELTTKLVLCWRSIQAGSDSWFPKVALVSGLKFVPYCGLGWSYCSCDVFELQVKQSNFRKMSFIYSSNSLILCQFYPPRTSEDPRMSRNRFFCIRTRSKIRVPLHRWNITSIHFVFFGCEISRFIASR